MRHLLCSPFLVFFLSAQSNPSQPSNLQVVVHASGNAYGLDLPRSWHGPSIPLRSGPFGIPVHAPRATPKPGAIFELQFTIDDTLAGEIGSNCNSAGVSSQATAPASGFFKVYGRVMNFGKGNDLKAEVSRDISSGMPHFHFLLTDAAGSRMTLNFQPNPNGNLPRNVVCDWRQNVTVGVDDGPDARDSSYDLKGQSEELSHFAHGTLALANVGITRNQKAEPKPQEAPQPVVRILPRKETEASVPKVASGSSQVLVSLEGVTGDGQDKLGIFGGQRLSNIPFKLDLTFEDKDGGKLGSICSGPDARSLSSEDTPSTAVLTLGTYRYEFGKRGDYFAVAYRHTQGVAFSHLVEMHFMLRQGQHIRDHKADPDQSQLDIWVAPDKEVRPPLASCDWRAPLTMTLFEKYDAKPSFFTIVGGDNPYVQKASANLFLSSLTITRTGVSESDNKPVAAGPLAVIDPKNLIIGHWTAKNKNTAIVAADVEFTPTEQIANGVHWPVKYYIDGDDITVSPKGTFPRTCTMQGTESMVCHTPTGRFEMLRLK